ncbi:hypothetical protein [Poritiphilus flavus]|uniref:Lipocalin-like domain-containing protein n=1 Tax=Poritiphilus flavus TaxID=2697053 RepID=A0A6L9EFZ3_9FLAO|nr:hypothetical protein [Poritiphilus flavus]NAS13593.1 hypothetical protein [Poritiphilus flavus]
MIKKLLAILALLAVVLSFSNCSSDNEEDDGLDFSACSLNGPNFSISEVTGNWVATQANFDIPGTTQQVDVVAEGGTVTLNVQADGGFTLVITEVGEAGETTTGDLAFCEGIFTVRYDDAPNIPEILNASLNGGIFQITGPVEFDVDGDGSDDEAFVILVLERS